MKKLRLLVVSAPLSLVAALGAGCAGDGASTNDASDIAMTEQASEISSTVTDTAKLGQAYDSQRKKLMFRSCVTGQVVKAGNTKNTLQLRKDMNFDDVLEACSGSLSVGLSIPVIKAQAGAKLAIRHSATSFSETQHLFSVITAQSDTLDPDSIAIASNAQALVGTPAAETRCGNEFIAEVHKGASLLATMKVEFLNKEDQSELGGKLMVNVLGGTIEASGELEKIAKEKLERTQLTIEVEQLGGDPVALLAVMPDNVMTCSLLNRDPCVRVFENVIKYAKDPTSGFLAQLNNGQYNVLKYVTQTYADSNAYELVPPDYTPVDPAVKQRIQLVEQGLRAAMEDELRASNLLKNSGSLLPDGVRVRLGQIGTLASENVTTYADMSTYCYANMNQSCLTYVQTNSAFLHGSKADGGYDRSELEISLTPPPPPPETCAGCLIGSSCIPNGGTEPGNGCHVCDTSKNRTGYSNLADGNACDDGQFCSDASQCKAGICTATVPHPCAANTFCDEVFDTCRCINTNWYKDADGDGYGDPSSSVAACAKPSGYVSNSGDCCDRDTNTHPGQTSYFQATNACGSWDYDCSGTTNYAMDCKPVSGYTDVTSCGCTTKGTCNVSMCGTSQDVVSRMCNATYGCSYGSYTTTTKRALQCH